MTAEQLARRNAAIGAAMRRLTPEQLAGRGRAISQAWDDPLTRSIASAKKTMPGSKRSSKEAYNAYYRAYRAGKRTADA